MKRNSTHFPRRTFVRSVLAAGVAGLAQRKAFGFWATPVLEAGEGVVDVTPPLGVELAGFHRTPGKERRATGIRQPSAARAIVLRHGGTQAAIVSLDALYVDLAMTRRVQAQIEKQLGLPAANVRICATHTHSMPSFRHMRQWGAAPKGFGAEVEKKIVEAVARAKEDLAPAELWVGQARTVGANHNRTTKQFKTDELFSKDSTDADRWLDTLLQTLHFRRAGGRRDLLWYHFSAHAVCFADELAGPDWPGLIAEKLRNDEKLEPSFLQGHIGDVNPGDGDPWRGDADDTVKGVYPALRRALAEARKVATDVLRVATTDHALPLDLDRFKSWLAEYKNDPAKCNRGVWVDAPFAADWFQGANQWDFTKTRCHTVVSAMQLGEVGLVFHPSELYSYYGLAIRRGSRLPTTLVVGYADDMVGYLPDPKAFADREYSAIVVPKILDLPPFTPSAAQGLADTTVKLLNGLAG
jgi:neutral ceramidase